MHKFALDLMTTLTPVCPTFLAVPLDVPYPHITVEPQSCLTGVPKGPTVAIMCVKILSRYRGLREILLLKRDVDHILATYLLGSIKIQESVLSLLDDKVTHVHTFRLRVKGASHE